MEKTSRDRTHLPPKIFDNSHAAQDLLQGLDPLLGPHHAAFSVLWFPQSKIHYVRQQTLPQLKESLGYSPLDRRHKNAKRKTRYSTISQVVDQQG